MQWALEHEHLHNEDMSFRIYLTDSVKYSSEHKSISERWYDLLRRSHDFDPNEVVSDVIERAGLVVIDNESSGSGGQDNLR